jgi:hypothetical protein
MGDKKEIYIKDCYSACTNVKLQQKMEAKHICYQCRQQTKPTNPCYSNELGSSETRLVPAPGPIYGVKTEKSTYTYRDA